MICGLIKTGAGCLALLIVASHVQTTIAQSNSSTATINSIGDVSIAPRIGLAGDKFQGWIGGFYLNADKELSVSTNVSGVPVLIDVDLEVVVPWNFIYGFRWEPNKNLEFIVEHGFSGRNQIILAAAIRF